MQADNEQAPRMEHAEEAFLTLCRCHPQHLEFVCSPWQPLCQEETALVPHWEGTARGTCPMAQPQPGAQSQESSLQCQCTSGLGPGTDWHCFGPGATLAGMWQTAAPRASSALAGKRISPTTPHPGFGLGQTACP